MDLASILQEVMGEVESHRGEGKVADYIPALAEVDPRKLGIAVALGDGSVHRAGDADEAFSIQSVSKIFTLGLALERVGPRLWKRVGREPSGSSFNSIVQLEREEGKPRNPLINPGAMVVTDFLIGDRDGDAAIAQLLDYLRTRSGDPSVKIDEAVAASEAATGARNRSLAWFMASFGNLDNPVDEVLSAYFRQCAIAMSCTALARAALPLAFDGVDPVSGERILTKLRSRRINALMMTCGHYDGSGDFAFRIGLPGKSGVGGGIVAIVPRVGAITVWSPGLNAQGTSAVGSRALEALVERTGWSVFV